MSRLPKVYRIATAGAAAFSLSLSPSSSSSTSSTSSSPPTPGRSSSGDGISIGKLKGRFLLAVGCAEEGTFNQKSGQKKKGRERDEMRRKKKVVEGELRWEGWNACNQCNNQRDEKRGKKDIVKDFSEIDKLTFSLYERVWCWLPHFFRFYDL